MKYAVVALLAVVVVVNAMPHGGVPPFHPGLLATQYQNTALHGANGFANGLHAFGAHNFGAAGASHDYDRGAQESSFSSMTNAHQKSSHDRGSSHTFGVGGGSVEGLDQTSAGFNQFAGLNSLGSTVLSG